MSSRLIPTMAVALLCATASASADTSTAPSRDEQALQMFRAIQKQVLNYPHYTVFDSISASIGDDGVVTISGKVTMPYKRDAIERRVSEVSGVRQVHNRIDVLPASKSDDELRLGIARAIYNNPAFQRYAARANPPIHVIVERGRVTLEGTITDQAERLLALSIARSFDAFAVTDELKTEAEGRKDLERL